MILTVALIKQIAPLAQTKDIEKVLPFLNHALPRYEITTPIRVSMFLSQALTETLRFFSLKEFASGDAYDTRVDLGNTPEKDGDGRKWKGRGIFQTTGKTNYTRVSKALGIDCLTHPEMLEEPKWAVESACLYWKDRSLNTIADTGDIVKMSKRINGGTNGLEERIAYYNKAMMVLKNVK